MKKSAVFILLGQSNAVGHAIPMKKGDIITPLKNVYGLSRTKNQTYENRELFWDHYTSYGMNLAEEQDNTYSLANQLAKRWQENIDDGMPMNYENLYIVQIAIGSQGVTEKYMWYPQRPKKLIGGKHGTVDISLYSFTGHIISMIDDSLKKMGKDYEIIGVHWRGGEEDAYEDIATLERVLLPIYEEMIINCNKILNTPPIILHNRNLSISRCFYLYLFRAYFTIRKCFKYIFCIAGAKGDETVFNVKQPSAGIEIVSSKVEFDSIHLCPFIQIQRSDLPN